MFDIHAYKILFIFVDNSDPCGSLAEVDRKIRSTDLCYDK